MATGVGDRKRDCALVKAPWYDIPRWWPYCEQWVAQALEGRSITLKSGDVYMGCLSRTMTLWLAVRVGTPLACAVSEIITTRGVRTCQILVIGGREIDAWMQFEEEIRKMAKERGCVAIEGCGRPGWQKKAPEYKPVYMIYRRML